jgi:hypothetical protein
MNDVTKDAVEKIEQIHSNWIEFERTGEHHRLMALCADDIELWLLGCHSRDLVIVGPSWLMHVAPPQLRGGAH